MKQIVARNDKRNQSYYIEFAEIFGQPLSKFLDALHSFDVIALDDWLETPDGKSMSDIIKERYGARAEAMCRKLIG